MDKDRVIPQLPDEKIKRAVLFIPLTFWLDVIAYLDKRLEMVKQTSGHGILKVEIKMYRGRISEVNFGEEIRVRDIIEKIDGPAAHTDTDHGNPDKKNLRVLPDQPAPILNTE